MTDTSTVTPEQEAAKLSTQTTPEPVQISPYGGDLPTVQGLTSKPGPTPNTPEPGQTFTGPNAQDAADWIANVRGQANWPKDANTPAIIQVMADARARGYTRDQITQRIGEFKDYAQKMGYSGDELNHYFYGVPLKDPLPGTRFPLAPETANIPDKLASAWRDMSARFGAPHDPFTAAGLPTPGFNPQSASDVLGSLGWGTMDAAKTFGTSFLNGAAATAELVDGKPKTAWETAKLGYEATGFFGVFIPDVLEAFGPKAGKPPLPPEFEAVNGADRFQGRPATGTYPRSPIEPGGTETIEGQFREIGKELQIPGPRDFVDGATMTAQHMEGGVTPENVASAMRGLGENYAKTGQHPVDAAADLINGRTAEMPRVDPEVKSSPIPPDDPQATVEADNAAADKATPPGREEFTPDAKGMSFEEFWKDESGALKLPQMVDIDPEKLFQPDPEMGKGLVHDIMAIFRPHALAPNTAEMIRDVLARSTVATERSVGNLVRFGRAVEELSTPQRLNMIDDIETGKLAGNPRWGGPDSPLQAMGRQLRSELDHVYTQMANRGIEPGYIDDYLPHMWADENAYRTWQKTRPMAGGKSFTKERVFGSYKEGIEAGLTPATDNPISMAAVAIKSMNRYIAA